METQLTYYPCGPLNLPTDRGAGLFQAQRPLKDFHPLVLLLTQPTPHVQLHLILARNSHDFFLDDEYVLSNLAFNPTANVVPAFKSNKHCIPTNEEEGFNRHHLGMRALLERIVPLGLKQRGPSLCECLDLSMSNS
ncbi:uncharacterized protein VP01_2652g3 [Puccinia sorghi]|uniref:Uncharacterized protein n=1 Tax=Puccinia sorghi TaxID=27349 RepID=A0A0L6V4V3_9BASI|nr:uncharacterized protein VP01_2652g3 [Puccinia sorghi]